MTRYPPAFEVFMGKEWNDLVMEVGRSAHMFIGLSWPSKSPKFCFFYQSLTYLNQP